MLKCRLFGLRQMMMQVHAVPCWSPEALGAISISERTWRWRSASEKERVCPKNGDSPGDGESDVAHRGQQRQQHKPRASQTLAPLSPGPDVKHKPVPLILFFFFLGGVH